MAFESLASKLGGVFKKLRGKGKLSEQDVKDAMREDVYKRQGLCGTAAYLCAAA